MVGMCLYHQFHQVQYIQEIVKQQLGRQLAALTCQAIIIQFQSYNFCQTCHTILGICTQDMHVLQMLSSLVSEWLATI